MLKLLATFFGFSTAVAAPPPRPPSARKRSKAAPPTKPETPKPAPARHRLITRLPTLGEAVRAYAQSVGEFGSKPSPEYLALCRAVTGEDFWAYLQAVTLTGGRVTTFAIGVPRLGVPAAEQGLELRLEKLTYTDLDFWDDITKREAARREAALFAGRTPPEPIKIPERVLLALAKRLAARAARVTGGQRRNSGGMTATPETTDGVVTEIPDTDEPGNPEGPDDSPAADALPVPK